MTREEHRQANLASWDEAVAAHLGAQLYNVPGFRAGADSLSAIELVELGPWVGAGTTLLHLQCHIGLDTLSWARRGAVVTGVDFSGEAIRAARRLADEVGLAGRATFVQSDVYDLPAALHGVFDVVFASWGVLMWLDDLDRWAEIVCRFLAPDGVFCLCEFHPYAFALADNASAACLRLGYPYFQGDEPLRFDDGVDYADPAVVLEHRVTYEWPHGLGEIVDPLLRAGLRLDRFRELPFTVPGLPFAFLEPDEAGLLRVAGHRDSFPLSFTLLMTKEG
jgi:SAM-dependent methyltransferase